MEGSLGWIYAPQLPDLKPPFPPLLPTPTNPNTSGVAGTDKNQEKLPESSASNGRWGVLSESGGLPLEQQSQLDQRKKALGANLLRPSLFLLSFHIIEYHGGCLQFHLIESHLLPIKLSFLYTQMPAGVGLADIHIHINA